jgi:hypothetical protein
MDNADQFPKRNAEATTESKKNSAFGGGDLNDTGNSGAQDSVFRPEIGDLTQQGRLGDMDEKEKDGVDGESGHGKGVENGDFLLFWPERFGRDRLWKRENRSYFGIVSGSGTCASGTDFLHSACEGIPERYWSASWKGHEMSPSLRGSKKRENVEILRFVNPIRQFRTQNTWYRIGFGKS